METQDPQPEAATTAPLEQPLLPHDPAALRREKNRERKRLSRLAKKNAPKIDKVVKEMKAASRVGPRPRPTSRPKLTPWSAPKRDGMLTKRPPKAKPAKAAKRPKSKTRPAKRLRKIRSSRKLAVTPQQIRAIRILKAKPLTPKQFAHKMWPKSPGWNKKRRCGAHGKVKGMGMNVTAGCFLGKLYKRKFTTHGKAKDGTRTHVAAPKGLALLAKSA